jgi:SHS2 domain-containing protein
VSFAFVDDVTSDLSFVARGADLAALFAAAGDALLAATLADLSTLEPRVRRPLALAEPDAELLLLHFLNELVYLRDSEQLLLRAPALSVEADGVAHLAGDLVGEPIDRTRHVLLAEVKAATAHGLRVAPVAGGWEARVTLDV